ncbi:hypothetical protein OZX57_00325 [Bifidobacterium sp. ESL0682]|uniref:hypothetical protein n=1 Tax=Bifidobacterium sp. ESL0682 TaxID=2983212 RepID=UPI0023F6BD3C|nr:hypothetical protein [Bifidobacterium sp. ESL0682]WEV42019.1 hypothetical protein OZX57_00325 [Bifidobacterium sp. ESL0682]
MDLTVSLVSVSSSSFGSLIWEPPYSPFGDGTVAAVALLVAASEPVPDLGFEPRSFASADVQQCRFRAKDGDDPSCGHEYREQEARI